MSYNFRRRFLGASSNLVFSLLPDGVGYSEVATSQELYATYSSLFTGAWWLLNGDGTSHASGVSLSGVGTPTTQNVAVLPSGTNGRTLSTTRLNGTSQRYETAGVAAPLGSFSIGALVYVDSIANSFVITKYAGVGSRAAHMQIQANGIPTCAVLNNAGSGSGVTAAAAVVPRSWNFLVFTYTFVGAGTSLLKFYINGVQSGATTSTGVGPAAPTAAVPWAVGSGTQVGSELWTRGCVRAAFMTETALSDANVLAMNNTLNGVLTGSKGEAVTITRTQAETLIDDNGLVHTAPGLRPPVVRSGVVNDYSATNIILRSDAFDHASWTKTGVTAAAPTVTADLALSPDGITTTGDQIACPAVLAAEASYVTQGVVATAAAYSGSVWLKGAVGGEVVYLSLHNATVPTYHTTACTLTTSWQRFTVANKTLTGATWNLRIGVETADVQQSPQGAQTFFAWGAQVQAASNVTSYIRTEGATAGDGVTNPTFSTAAFPTTSGEISIKVRADNPICVNNTILSTVSGTNGITLLINSNGGVWTRIGNAGAQTTCVGGALAWTRGQFYTIRVVWGGGNVSTYRDGVLQTGAITNGTANMPTAHAATCTLGGTTFATANGISMSSLEVRR